MFGSSEAAVIRDEKGQPTLAFIQVSRNTFIELAPASTTDPHGVRMELSELGPDSMLGKAIAGWK